MKSCHEMADRLLKRREQYEAEKRNRRKTLVQAITPICCVCLVALLGVGAWQGGLLDNKPAPITDGTVYSATSGQDAESKGESADNPQAGNKIVINKIDSVSADRFNICLLNDDFVKMDQAAVNEHYGINVFPELPEGVFEWDDAIYGIYKRNGGTGEVYWDQMVFNFDNEDFSRSVNIEVKKGSLPVYDWCFYEPVVEKSIINNLEIVIGQTENGNIYAKFMYHNVGFCVNTRGLTQDEFVAVLASIIK